MSYDQWKTMSDREYVPETADEAQDRIDAEDYEMLVMSGVARVSPTMMRVTREPDMDTGACGVALVAHTSRGIIVSVGRHLTTLDKDRIAYAVARLRSQE